MADFSDREDMQLIQLAHRSVVKTGRVDWNDVAFKMVTTRKGKAVLRERLRTLKKRYGTNLAAFPPRFFRQLPRLRAQRQSAPVVHNTHLERQSAKTSDAQNTLAEKPSAEASDAHSTHVERQSAETSDDIASSSSSSMFNDCIDSISATNVYTDQARIFEVVHNIFASVSSGDVRQPGGQMESNTGEISMVGVSKMLAAFGEIDPDHVFVDIGSGIGNVVAQVALQAPFKRVVGVEMRERVLAIGAACMTKVAATEPLLQRVHTVHADIRYQPIHLHPRLAQMTHLFCSNLLFAEDSNLVLEELCLAPSLQYVAITRPFCPRHRALCSKTFCWRWQLQETIEVPMTYTSKLVRVSVYVRASPYNA
jgi:hypothetical protein